MGTVIVIFVVGTLALIFLKIISLLIVERKKQEENMRLEEIEFNRAEAERMAKQQEYERNRDIILNPQMLIMNQESIDKETRLQELADEIKPDESVNDYLDRLSHSDYNLAMNDYRKNYLPGLSSMMIEYTDPVYTESELYDMTFEKISIQDSVTIILMDNDHMPCATRIPAKLLQIVASKFKLHKDGYIDFSHPLNKDEYSKFLHNYRIRVNSFEVPRTVTLNGEFFKTPHTSLDKAIEMSNDVHIVENKGHVLDEGISSTNIFAIKFIDEETKRIITKETKNRSVFEHYHKTFAGRGIGFTPNVMEFINWYNDATDEIMKLEDVDGEGYF